MPTYSFFDYDNRVRRYAETLAQRGDHVEVFCLRKKGQKRHETVHGVEVHRIQERIKNERNKLSYIYRTTLFLLQSTLQLMRGRKGQKYDLVHVHNIPDTEVFSALWPRLRGAKVILDIHDLVPELFCSKFSNLSGALLFKLLCGIERLSANCAHHVIVSNHLWKKKLEQRSVSPGRCSVFVNYPDPRIFHPQDPAMKNGKKLTIVYPGTLNSHQGLDLAVKAFARVLLSVPDAEFHIYGDGPTRPALQELAKKLAVEKQMKFSECIPLDAIPAVLASSTLGVVPKRADGFGNEAFSTKILEFMAVGIPVIASATDIDRYYFSDSEVLFFESGNVDDLAEKMMMMIRDEELRKQYVSRGLDFASTHNWDSNKKAYLQLVDGLVNGGE